MTSGLSKDTHWFTIVTGIQLYFCDSKVTLAARKQRAHHRPDPPVPPRRLDFRTLRRADLDAIAEELNERPRQTLGSRHHHKQ